MMRRGGPPTGTVAMTIAVNERARLAVFIGMAAVALGGCDPYEGFGKGDDSLGAVDPVTFPAANLGAGGNRMQAGVGVFQEVAGFAGGTPVGYFPYLYPTAATPIPDPRRLRDNGAPYARVPTPGVYTFDPPPDGASPLPATYPCSAPPGYMFDEARDEVRMDQMGAVFGALPSATYTMGVASTTTYLPIVAEWPLGSAGQPCQKLKSRAQVESVFGPFDPSKASGKFMAWLIIDPAAAVYRFDDNPDTDLRGLDLQRWGWFNRYLLAYLDGGYIPTVEEMIEEGGAMKTVLRMQPQRLYYPRSQVVTMGAGGMPSMAAGLRGAGYDVLAARRGEPGYSPLCEVFTYDAGMVPLPPEQLPRTAADIETMFGGTLMPAANRYIFCLQVR
jgi:hypothetical protein